MTVGFHCSHEQHPPSTLLRLAQRADDAGFEAAMCSDHFRPWSERQGQSGFAWSWLGAALHATSMSFGTVCAPGWRYHPAVIAQAAATLAEMFSGRFWLAVGSGEALNESVTGGGWPSKTERHARLRASVDVMRALWAGETVTTRGPVTVVDAKLYTRPTRPPLLLGAALTAETAFWLGGLTDGLITVAGPRDEMRHVIDAFREGGGEGKPLFLQVALSFARTDREAEEAAYDQWRQSVVSTRELADLATPEEFDRACANADRSAVLSRVRASADIERHLAWLYDDLRLGYERVYLHNVAPADQERFIAACGERLLPGLRRAAGASPETRA